MRSSARRTPSYFACIRVETKMKYIDLHSDTLTSGGIDEHFLKKEYKHISLNKLKKNGVFAQSFAVFVDSTQKNAYKTALKYLEIYKKRKSEIEENGIIPLLSVEDGGAYSTDEKLETVLSYGVKTFGITWNKENALGYPCGSRDGLKMRGFRTVENLLSRKIIVDISHLSKKGVKEVVSLSKKYAMPVIASHSLSLSVCPHPRNLDDETIRQIASTGGVVGLTFVKEFVGENFASHLEHVWKIGGENVLALGSDFDGTENPVVENAENFLDVCSAPGGKSVLLSKRMKSVVSCELHEHRVALIESYATRMHATNVTPMQADGTVFNPEFKDKFDGVLCDVPCSGFGTVSENPDIKLQRKEEDFVSLNKTQLAILSNASKYVKKGGHLYYSTCSVFEQENDNIVEKFLKTHPEFTVQTTDCPLTHETKKYGLQFLPDTAFGAGFYVAKLKRKE